jgi:hypothetical protein
MISQHTPQQATITFSACPGHPILLHSSLAGPLGVESYHSLWLSCKYVNTHPTELSTVNPDHHHSTPAATTPIPQLTSPLSARSLIPTFHYSSDYPPPSPSTIPVVSFSSSLSPLLRNMPPIHPLSSVTSSLAVSQSNQLSPGQEVPLVKSGASGAPLQERMGWWIAWALKVRVVGTLGWSPPCRSYRVPHFRAWPQRAYRVRTEYPWPLVSFRLLSPVGHFHSPPEVLLS